MRPFRVDDIFKGNCSDTVTKIVWVDSSDHYCAVTDIDTHTKVYASQFLNHWTLIKEGPARTAQG